MRRIRQVVAGAAAAAAFVTLAFNAPAEANHKPGHGNTTTTIDTTH